MPTIADYLDNAPKRKTDNFQVDLYYLHVPRAIVKKAADEDVEWVDVPKDKPFVLDRPIKEINTPAGSVKIPDTIKTPWGTFNVPVGFVSDNFLKPLPENTPYTGDNIYEAYTNQFFGGNGDSKVLKFLSDAEDAQDYINRISYVANRGGKILNVKNRRMLRGDATYPDMLSYAAEQTNNMFGPDAAKPIYNAATMGYDYVNSGKDGKSPLFGPDFASGQELKAMNQIGLANPKRRYKDKGGYASKYDGQLSDDDIAEYNNLYYTPEVEANAYKDNLWGWLDQNPGLRGALRYATPWLAYGIPLSAIGSMMGTNALWGPTLLGAVGAGAYGYGVGSGYLDEFSKSDFGKMLDTIHSTANKPIGSIVNYINEDAGRLFNRVNVDDDWRLENRQQQPPPKKTEPGANAVTTYNARWGNRVPVQGQEYTPLAPEPKYPLLPGTQPEFNTPLLGNA